ncbi:MAG TPA: diacylglyceryl transferase [Bacteroidales bacterium]|nr:MAG: hypothetical protein A2W98_02760 [Bacteroidetes bacterium GWF2_33_38]OFY75146.1 MAG: hypothetical protein A2265_03230 [Bacteroidetes bacterium RIFOXYA12_FULL_33_9]HBF87611.1 diacylglyceryl transferase [Bacteroidales bacterium]
MYPRISDLIADIFGINVPLPIQSFGFFVALAFVAVSFVLVAELKRKEKLGKIPTTVKRTLRGGHIKVVEWIIGAIIGFALGFKLFETLLDYTAFVNNPQEFILSARGSIFGGFLGVAISLGLKYWTYYKEKKKYKQPTWEETVVRPHEHTANLIVYGAIFGLIGSKIFHNLEYIDEFFKDPIEALFSFSGLTFYGGLFVAAIALIWYANKNKIKPLHIMDTTAPGLALGYGVGRVGCHVSGDGDWGIVANWGDKLPNFLPEWFWQYRFPHNVINEGIPIEGCVGHNCFILENPVYPTAMWEAILGILIFVFLWSIRKRINIAGVMFSIYMILQGIERFFIEKIRVNSVYHILGREITQAEIISFVSIMIGVVGVIYFYKNKKRFLEY